MNTSAILITAALMATTGTVAAAQTPISDLRGPVATSGNSVSDAIAMGTPSVYTTDEGRFNDFQGPVVRQ